MLEIKANMRWCRDAAWMIDNIIEKDSKFKKKENIDCEFLREETVTLSYEDNVELFLISLTDGSCPEIKHIKNKEYASLKNVNHYLLFSGWYCDLNNKEIVDFALKLEQL